MRKASTFDKEYVAQCFVDISQFMKSKASGFYIDGLPDAVDKTTLELASTYINDDDAIVLIVERKNIPVACIAGRIENTSFSPRVFWSSGLIQKALISSQYLGKIDCLSYIASLVRDQHWLPPLYKIWGFLRFVTLKVVLTPGKNLKVK